MAFARGVSRNRVGRALSSSSREREGGVRRANRSRAGSMPVTRGEWHCEPCAASALGLIQRSRPIKSAGLDGRDEDEPAAAAGPREKNSAGTQRWLLWSGHSIAMRGASAEAAEASYSESGWVQRCSTGLPGNPGVHGRLGYGSHWGMGSEATILPASRSNVHGGRSSTPPKSGLPTARQ